MFYDHKRIQQPLGYFQLANNTANSLEDVIHSIHLDLLEIFVSLVH